MWDLPEDERLAIEALMATKEACPKVDDLGEHADALDRLIDAEMLIWWETDDLRVTLTPLGAEVLGLVVVETGDDASGDPYQFWGWPGEVRERVVVWSHRRVRVRVEQSEAIEDESPGPLEVAIEREEAERAKAKEPVKLTDAETGKPLTVLGVEVMQERKKVDLSKSKSKPAKAKPESKAKSKPKEKSWDSAGKFDRLARAMADRSKPGEDEECDPRGNLDRLARVMAAKLSALDGDG